MSITFYRVLLKGFKGFDSMSETFLDYRQCYKHQHPDVVRARAALCAACCVLRADVTNAYCRTGNFRLEYIFAIFVRQASLAKFNVYRTFCHVIRYAAIHTDATYWTAE